MKTIIIIAALLVNLTAFSQQSTWGNNNTAERKLYNYSIAVQPQYLINGGLRLDFETRLKNPQHILQISALGHLLPKGDHNSYWESMLFDDDCNVRKLTGIGVALDYKWFPFQDADFLYFSGGISYNHFDVRYEGYQMIKYQEDGLNFYQPQWGEMKQLFDKTGANICLGIQTAPRRPFFVDGYIGFGYSYSFYDKNKYHMDDNMFNIGYRGVTFVTGLRIGYRFGKRN